MKTPEEIVNEMMRTDTYSQWMGIEVRKVREGFCELTMTVRAEMLNGHGITHGGISYALSDSALAFAANSCGQKAVTIETSIAHIAPVHLNDTLVATCTEINRGKTIARYETTITNQQGKLVARFNGTVFRSAETW